MTASQFRQNIFRLFDQILETGAPLEIEHNGRRLRTVAETPRKKLDTLKRRDCLRGDREDIVHMDWSKEWRP